ncbi:MAG: hypothetical protein K8R02_01840 [Anaerohalosphaeraceae bacterium]|nr:hypothetical protein [Anaerohalosphaeraceae bacterium]
MKATSLVKIIVISIVISIFSGCGIEEPAERIWLEEKPYTGQLPDAYNQITVRKSTSAYVLDNIKKSDNELISQSESVVACWGEKKKTSQLWQTVAAFDEESFTVWRKYFLAVDEKPWHLGAKGQKLRFDSESILDEATLAEPYTSENHKRIAIIETVLDNYRSDTGDVRQDSRALNTGVMMASQTIERLLYVLNQSPALAAKLSEENGLLFDHITLGKSRAKLLLKGDLAVLSIKIGRVSRKFGQ